MIPADYDFEIDRDRDFSQTFLFKDGNEVAINLTGYSSKAQLRPHKDSSTLIVEFTVVQVNASGSVTISLTDVQTLAITQSKAWWDLVLTDPSGLRKTYVEGRVAIRGTVTRA